MPGQIGWIDLTTADASTVRDFYTHVAGWTPTPVEMGGYQDYCMTPPGASEPVAGICHARGANAGLPPVWLIYITVGDLDEALRQCESRGGKLLSPVRSMGAEARYCIIQDPAGAAAALFEKAE